MGDSGPADSLWRSMLRDSMRKNRLSDGTVVFVGPKGSGKSSLLDTFRGLGSGLARVAAKDQPEGGPADHHERKSSVSGGKKFYPASSRSFHPVLAYSYFDATDPSEHGPERDDSPSRVGVWCCSELEFENLLGKVLRADNLEHTMVLVGLDLSKPWELMDSLERWTNVLEGHMNSLLQQLSVGAQDDLRDRVKKGLRTGGVPGVGSVVGGGAGDDMPKLEEGVLGKNLGVPMAVVCCKADTLQNDTFEQQQRLHFIQQHLRRFCLNYGAALVYTSAKEGVNCTQLQRYILSRLYPEVFTFTDPGQVTDAAFIPSGWDSKRLIDDLLAEENTPWGRGKGFTDVIRSPAPRSGAGLLGEGAGASAGGAGGRGSGRGQGGGEGGEEKDTLEPEEVWLRELNRQVAADGKGRKASGSLPSMAVLAAPLGSMSTPSGTGVKAKKDKPVVVDPDSMKDPRSFFEGLLAKDKK
ncbi:unnamed protein product [Discosporangium mesarthrocarpum]